MKMILWMLVMSTKYKKKMKKCILWPILVSEMMVFNPLGLIYNRLVNRPAWVGDNTRTHGRGHAWHPHMAAGRHRSQLYDPHLNIDYVSLPSK